MAWLTTRALGFWVVVGSFFFVADAIADGDDYKQVETLVDSAETIVGQPLAYPTTGPAHVTALLITLEPGEATGWHKHGVPVFAYILEGEATIDYGDGGQHVFQAGDAFLEAVDHWHDGRIISNKPAKILAVFMGAKGAQNVIKKNR